MDVNIKINVKRVYDLEEATHILATKDYGKIKKDEVVEIYDFCGTDYVYDFGADEENELFNELDENILLIFEASI